MSAKLGVTRQAVSLLVKELQAKGIIEQVPDPQKASAKLLRKTPFGKRFVADAMEIMAALETEVEVTVGRQQFLNLKQTLAADWGGNRG